MSNQVTQGPYIDRRSDQQKNLKENACWSLENDALQNYEQKGT